MFTPQIITWSIGTGGIGCHPDALLHGYRFFVHNDHRSAWVIELTMPTAALLHYGYLASKR